jgi:NosR/NirI family transcriptional regulator, nitrous oxide reductase regulator
MSTAESAASPASTLNYRNADPDHGKGKGPRNPLARYVRWLHTQWPAGTVEKLPRVNDDGSTNVPGLYVVGDLTGIPLLKFSSDTGAKAVARVAEYLQRSGSASGGDALDLVIVGAGVSGMAAALEAKKRGLRFEILEAAEPFSTIVNFPRGKPIYTYPTEMTPAGDLQFKAEIKEALVDELKAQTLAKGIVPKLGRAEKVTRTNGVLEVELATDLNTPGQSAAPSRIRARTVIVAIGRSGNFRMLGVPGEEKDKVYNRLHDPKEFTGKNVLVVGGGDSALETAIAIAEVGGHVTLSYRKPDFSRAKPDNVDRLNKLMADPMADVQVEKPTSERVTTAAGGFMGKFKKPGSIQLAFQTAVKRIDDDAVTLESLKDGGEARIANDAVFTMIGREAPLDFFRRSGVPISGDRGAKWWVTLILFVAFCVLIYHWKSNHPREFGLQEYCKNPAKYVQAHPRTPLRFLGTPDHPVFPYNLEPAAGREGNILYTLKKGLANPSFYYTLAYCTAVTWFGIRRIKRRKTPYVTRQTIVLILFQCIPLFILPEIILPWMGRNGFFEAGKPLRGVADALFETYDGGVGHERAYWRSYGFILAFPLNVYNVFTDHPLWWWLGISFVQTFVIIPLIIYKWGKGAYCGWICSCGALAETMGDTHRHKMPHGPAWNRVNMVGQAALAFAFIILGFRIFGWWRGENSWATHTYKRLFEDIPFLNYAWSVDILMGGIIGVGFYFWFSGRVWCRFACPLAALMHIYARFSRFRILADKKKCISCNVCTSVCHQGIDVMNFANKGMAMADPECVRCSACVQSCPTGVLSFGQIDRRTGQTLKLDKLQASPVQMVELRHNGKMLA